MEFYALDLSLLIIMSMSIIVCIYEKHYIQAGTCVGYIIIILHTLFDAAFSSFPTYALHPFVYILIFVQSYLVFSYFIDNKGVIQ